MSIILINREGGGERSKGGIIGGFTPSPQGLNSKEKEQEEATRGRGRRPPLPGGWPFEDWPHLSLHSCAGPGDRGLLAESDSTRKDATLSGTGSCPRPPPKCQGELVALSVGQAVSVGPRTLLQSCRGSLCTQQPKGTGRGWRPLLGDEHAGRAWVCQAFVRNQSYRALRPLATKVCCPEAEAPSYQPPSALALCLLLIGPQDFIPHPPLPPPI